MKYSNHFRAINSGPSKMIIFAGLTHRDSFSSQKKKGYLQYLCFAFSVLIGTFRDTDVKFN